MVAEMTGLPIANASLLDESTAAAEAMVMMLRAGKGKDTFLVADDCPVSYTHLTLSTKA